MKQFIDRLMTYWRLGPLNVARVGLYLAGLKSGLHPVLRISAPPPTGPFFAAPDQLREGLAPSTRWTNAAHYFACHDFPFDSVPDWLANPFKPGTAAKADQPWHALPDFNPDLGDIKAVWELSRFEWLIPMAERAALGDKTEIARLNAWLADWCARNPPYMGPNWKCGQEASIRVMHLAAAHLILGNEAAPGMRALISVHLKRIAPTMAYAIGQQNNHGSSEAAALFIGGSWLAEDGDKRGEAWSRLGRRWLENRAKALIEPDGTFSQYSTVYHRLMLDTFALAEVWRRRKKLRPFSDELKKRLAKAVEWLHHLTDPVSGDAPNLGANDGARLIPLNDAPYRDFRPSVQLAAALFCDARAYEESAATDAALGWLQVAAPVAAMKPPGSKSFDNGGLHVLKAGEARAFLRYPRFRFRPSQADALHTDLWIGARNLLRDAGTYSYAAAPDELDYFSGVRGHNSIQFDSRDQMPRLGRFLFGSWLKSGQVAPVTHSDTETTASASYTDWKGALHERVLRLSADRLICTDRVSGTAKTATLRWRLEPGDWHAGGATIRKDGVTISIKAEQGAAKPLLTQARESRHYLEVSDVPSIEMQVTVPNVITTEVRF